MHNEELFLFQPKKRHQRYIYGWSSSLDISPLTSAWPLERLVSVHYSDKPMETSIGHFRYIKIHLDSEA